MLRLLARTFLGLVVEAASPPVNFMPALWSGWHLTIDVYFYKVYLNTLDILFSWLLIRVRSGQSLKESAPILRVLFSFDVSDVFRGGSDMVSEFSQSLPRDLAYLFSPISSGISDLAYGSSSVLLLVWWLFFLGILIVP